MRDLKHRYVSRHGCLAISCLALLAACAAQTANTAVDPTAPTKQEIAEANAPPAEDQCGAVKMQSLVGAQKSAIPAAPAGAAWRVACTTCAVTMDYRPERLNIFFDEKTGEIKQVKCG
ncbi:MAG: I78 family peptidase inhibitor [Hyphomonadaceae bacterium]